MVDHLKHKTIFTVQYRSYTNFFVNLLENKHNGALFVYEANDVVSMMIEITILLLNMFTWIVNNSTIVVINNAKTSLSICYGMSHCEANLLRNKWNLSEIDRIKSKVVLSFTVSSAVHDYVHMKIVIEQKSPLNLHLFTVWTHLKTILHVNCDMIQISLKHIE